MQESMSPLQGERTEREKDVGEIGGAGSSGEAVVNR